MSLYSVTNGLPPIINDLNQIVSLLSGTSPPIISSVTVANRVRAQISGATATSGLAGSTTGGAPTSGTFALGDMVADTGFNCFWVCTTAGSPGSWTRIGGQAWGTTAWISTGFPILGDLNPPPAVSQTFASRTGRTGFDIVQFNYPLGITQPLGIPGFNASAYGYTIPATGTYLVHTRSVCTGPTGGTDIGIMVLKNGQPWQFGTQFLAYSNPIVKSVAVVPCNVNDLIQIGVYAEGSYSPTSTAVTSAFSCVYLGN